MKSTKAIPINKLKPKGNQVQPIIIAKACISQMVEFWHQKSLKKRSLNI
jgi:hypothetical protein